MSLVINTNTAATNASMNLQRSNVQLQKSLNRLSSGIKITSPSDDAGGLAVSMKLSAAIKRTDAVITGVANAVSFLQTQDGAMSTTAKVLSRFGELRTLYNDPTKNAQDKANYNTEFNALQDQLNTLSSSSFNGVNMFLAGVGTLNVLVTEDGQTNVAIDQPDFAAGLTAKLTDSSLYNLSDISIGDVTAAIQAVATLRATNGAQVSQLQFASEMLSVNKTNLESANSRIIDTDVAFESTQFARYNILVQSGTAMLAQANASTQAALRLLQ